MTGAVVAEAEPQWLAIARKELGVKEHPGGPNERIGQYLATVGGSEGDNWCAAFAAWCLLQAGIRGKYSPAAREFLKVGKPTEFKPGCLVVLWRVSPSDWRGHVGFGVRATSKTISILGGNQGADARVSIRAYPSSRLLGLRWPG